MKLARSFLFVGVVLVLGAGWLFAQAAQPTTIEGTMVDGRCYMMNPANTGDTHGKTEACGKLCMNSGAPAAVRTDAQAPPDLPPVPDRSSDKSIRVKCWSTSATLYRRRPTGFSDAGFSRGV